MGGCGVILDELTVQSMEGWSPNDHVTIVNRVLSGKESKEQSEN